MQEGTLERIIADIQLMPHHQLLQVRRVLDERLLTAVAPQDLPLTPRLVRRTQPPKDRTAEYQWMTQHRDEYAGQWVALDGDRLLAHNLEYEPVVAAARAAGVTDALILLVEASDALPFVGV